jgi:hypothetical protein
MGRLRNTKHERFAREVAALTPLGEAYRSAGFSGDEKWHRFNASRLRNKPAVKARIEELRLQFEELSAISTDYIRHKLLSFIEMDARELYQPDPADPTGKRLILRPLNELPERITKSITKLKLDPESGRPVEIVLAGKVESAATLLRSLPGGSSGEAVANVQINQITRVIVEPAIGGGSTMAMPMPAPEQARSAPAARIAAVMTKLNRSDINA